MTDKRKPEGIWGWLLLPVIGLIIGAIISIIVSFLSLFGYFFGEEWAYLTFLLLLVGAFFSIYSLFLIFNKRKEAPRWTILTIWYFTAVDIVLWLILPDTLWEKPSGVLLAPVIWTLYFVYSKRVKNTFKK